MRTKTMKLGGLAALAAAGLALTGCSATGGQTAAQPERDVVERTAETEAVEFEMGDLYVYSPPTSDSTATGTDHIYRMLVVDGGVQIKAQVCQFYDGRYSPVVGGGWGQTEGVLGDGAADGTASTVQVDWVDGLEHSRYAQSAELPSELTFTPLSVQVGAHTFVHTESTRGIDLLEQFTTSCEQTETPQTGDDGGEA